MADTAPARRHERKGCIIKRAYASGRVRYMIRIDGDADPETGKRRQIAQTFDTEEEAKEALKRYTRTARPLVQRDRWSAAVEAQHELEELRAVISRLGDGPIRRRALAHCTRLTDLITSCMGTAPPPSRVLRRGFTPKQRLLIIEAHERTCQYCGRSSASVTADPDGAPWEIDHVVAVTTLGKHQPDNWVLSCKACNQAKGDLPLAVWLHSADGPHARKRGRR